MEPPPSVGVNTTVWPVMVGLPPMFWYVMVSTPLPLIPTDVTYFDEIEVAAATPAAWLVPGQAPVDVYVSATASFAPAAKLKPSATLVRTV